MRLPIRLFILAGSALALLLAGLPQAQAGALPSLSWSPSTGPSAFAYAMISAGTTSSQTFTLRNSGVLLGTSALKVTLTGSSAFTIAGSTCSGRLLGPKKTCTVTVRYAPTTLGQRDTATLTAVSNFPAARASQTLTGSAAAQRSVDIYFSPVGGNNCLINYSVSGFAPNTSYGVIMTTYGHIIPLGPITTDANGNFDSNQGYSARIGVELSIAVDGVSSPTRASAC